MLRAAAEGAGGHSGGAVEGADEIGEIGEAHVERDVGDGARVLGEEARGAAQARAYQVLVRRHAEHAREEAKEMEWRQTDFSSDGFEIERLVGVVVEEERSLDRAAAIARAGRDRFSLATRRDVDETSRKREPRLVETDVASTLDRRLRELT